MISHGAGTTFLPRKPSNYLADKVGTCIKDNAGTVYTRRSAVALSVEISCTQKKVIGELVFTARRYASAVYAIVLCLSVSVCHTPVLYQNG